MTIKTTTKKLGAQYFNQRYADHKSQCVQRFYSNIFMDCGILLPMFGWTTKKEVNTKSHLYMSLSLSLSACVRTHSKGYSVKSSEEKNEYKAQTH